MDLSKLDDNLLKSLIKETIKENIHLFKDVLKEILVENEVIGPKEEGSRKARLEKMINDDFDQYDDVFKALA